MNRWANILVLRYAKDYLLDSDNHVLERDNSHSIVDSCDQYLNVFMYKNCDI